MIIDDIRREIEGCLLFGKRVIMRADHDAAIKALTEERDALARKVERVRALPRECTATMPRGIVNGAQLDRALADEEPHAYAKCALAGCKHTQYFNVEHGYGKCVERRNVNDAVAAERERCARIAETCSGEHHRPGCGCDRVIARAIRKQ